MRYAKAQGKITAYDPNWRPPLWKGRRKRAFQRMKSLIPLADIMKVSGEELELLTGKESLEEGAWALLEQGVSLAVVTLGARGCKAFAPGLSLEKPTYDTKVKDTTGSGDSFFGALLARIIQSGKRPEQLSPEELGDFLDFANAAGSTCATKTGAIPALPTTQEIEACRRNVPLSTCNREKERTSCPKGRAGPFCFVQARRGETWLFARLWLRACLAPLWGLARWL